jgi:capsule polysaccharide export protein KpsE/RkpR
MIEIGKGRIKVSMANEYEKLEKEVGKSNNLRKIDNLLQTMVICLIIVYISMLATDMEQNKESIKVDKKISIQMEELNLKLK